jgi:hypothetical protein
MTFLLRFMTFFPRTTSRTSAVHLSHIRGLPLAPPRSTSRTSAVYLSHLCGLPLAPLRSTATLSRTTSAVQRTTSALQRTISAPRPTTPDCRTGQRHTSRICGFGPPTDHWRSRRRMIQSAELPPHNLWLVNQLGARTSDMKSAQSSCDPSSAAVLRAGRYIRRFMQAAERLGPEPSLRRSPNSGAASLEPGSRLRNPAADVPARFVRDPGRRQQCPDLRQALGNARVVAQILIEKRGLEERAELGLGIAEICRRTCELVERPRRRLVALASEGSACSCDARLQSGRQ